MKKRTITVLSVTAIFITALIFVSAAVIRSNTPKLNFIMEVPCKTIEEGETFSIQLKLSNGDLESFYMSGFQIEIPYDTSAMSVVSIVEHQNSGVSQSDFYAENGIIKYVTVKDSFTDTRGYESLNNIFKIEFEAKKNISRPADFFPTDSVNIIPGDTLNRLIPNYSLTLFLEGAPTAGITDHIGKSSDVFDIYLYLNNIDGANKITVSDLSYDKAALTLVSGEWLLENTSSADFALTTGNAEASFTTPTDINENALKLTFRINDTTADGAYSVNFKASAEYENGRAALQIVPAVITVKNIIRGDVNGDNTVNSDDAIHLLYSILFGNNSYPVNQTTDFDGNNTVNSDDAIYLLYHILFGAGLYPLN